MFIKNRKKNSSDIISEINITPFVDILLVILIIFMVTAPMLDNGFDVNLPTSTQNAIQSKESKTIIISLDEKSNIFYENKKFNLTQLSKELEKQNKTTTNVFIKADSNIKYKEVIDLMSFLAKNGFSNISLITQPK